MQQTLISGDTLTFLTTLSDYPATAGWVLSYRLVPRTVGQSAVTLTSTPEGVAHRITATAAATAGWGVGDYGWSAWVTKSAERYTVDSGQITVLADPSTVSAGTDRRTQAEKALDDSRAALAAWSPTRRKYRIGEREMEFNGQADIVAIVNFWETEVARERRQADKAKGLADKRQTYIRLGRN